MKFCLKPITWEVKYKNQALRTQILKTLKLYCLLFLKKKKKGKIPLSVWKPPSRDPLQSFSILLLFQKHLLDTAKVALGE